MFHSFVVRSKIKRERKTGEKGVYSIYRVSRGIILTGKTNDYYRWNYEDDVVEAMLIRTVGSTEVHHTFASFLFRINENLQEYFIALAAAVLGENRCHRDAICGEIKKLRMRLVFVSRRLYFLVYLLGNRNVRSIYLCYVYVYIRIKTSNLPREKQRKDETSLIDSFQIHQRKYRSFVPLDDCAFISPFMKNSKFFPLSFHKHQIYRFNDDRYKAKDDRENIKCRYNKFVQLASIT